METGRGEIPDRFERLAYRLRWLIVLWIIGWWVRFLCKAKIIGSLGLRVLNELLSWLR